MNKINFVLRFDWFDKIEQGIKTNEYRTVTTWEPKIKDKVKEFHEGKALFLELQRGYTKTKIKAKVLSINIINGLDSDLKINESVYDFHFSIQKK